MWLDDLDNGEGSHARCDDGCICRGNVDSGAPRVVSISTRRQIPKAMRASDSTHWSQCGQEKPEGEPLGARSAEPLDRKELKQEHARNEHDERKEESRWRQSAKATEHTKVFRRFHRQGFRKHV